MSPHRPPLLSLAWAATLLVLGSCGPERSPQTGLNDDDPSTTDTSDEPTGTPGGPTGTPGETPPPSSSTPPSPSFDPSPTPPGTQPPSTSASTPQQPSDWSWPEGQFYLAGIPVYYLTSDTSGPVAYYSAYTWDEANAPASERAASTEEFLGTYIGVVFRSANAFLNGLDPDCLVEEELIGFRRTEGSIRDVDLDSCEECSLYSFIYTEYTSDTGCPRNLLNTFYAAEPDRIRTFYWGYRDTAESGWPEEFETYRDTLEDIGYTGSMYQELHGDFTPALVVRETDLDAKISSRQMLEAELQRMDREIPRWARPIRHLPPR